MIYGFDRSELRQRIRDHRELTRLACCPEIAAMHRAIIRLYRGQLSRMRRLGPR